MDEKQFRVHQAQIETERLEIEKARSRTERSIFFRLAIPLAIGLGVAIPQAIFYYRDHVYRTEADDMRRRDEQFQQSETRIYRERELRQSMIRMLMENWQRLRDACEAETRGFILAVNAIHEGFAPIANTITAVLETRSRTSSSVNCPGEQGPPQDVNQRLLTIARQLAPTPSGDSQPVQARYRVHIQIRSEGDRAIASELQTRLIQANYIVPGIEYIANAAGSPTRGDVRHYRPNQAQDASRLREAVESILRQLPPSFTLQQPVENFRIIDLSSRLQNLPDLTMEIWLPLLTRNSAN